MSNQPNVPTCSPHHGHQSRPWAARNRYCTLLPRTRSTKALPLAKPPNRIAWSQKKTVSSSTRGYVPVDGLPILWVLGRRRLPARTVWVTGRRLIQDTAGPFAVQGMSIHTHSLSTVFTAPAKLKLNILLTILLAKSGYKYSMILGYPGVIMAGVSDPACIKTIPPPSFDTAASAVQVHNEYTIRWQESERAQLSPMPPILSCEKIIRSWDPSTPIT